MLPSNGLLHRYTPRNDRVLHLTMTTHATINHKEIIKLALLEDLSPNGDVTSLLVVPEQAQATAEIRAKDNGIFAGTAAARMTLETCAEILKLPQASLEFLVNDGARVSAGDIIAQLNGNARLLLAAERTMLNLMQRLSGIATKTQRMVELIRNYPVKLLDTRKTTAGLRHFEKAAFVAGGGSPHRYNLSDMVLIKENHLLFGLLDATVVADAHARGLRVECEIAREDQLEAVLASGVDVVMLDNFSPERTCAVVTGLGLGRKVKLEASGGIDENNLVNYAQSGVDYISTSKVYTDVRNLDLTMLLA